MMSLKDNKIDIMCSKIGMIITECDLVLKDTKNPEAMQTTLDGIKKALRVLQEDLEVLRKCTLDNPDFKWNNDKTGGYTEDKVKAFRNE